MQHRYLSGKQIPKFSARHGMLFAFCCRAISQSKSGASALESRSTSLAIVLYVQPLPVRRLAMSHLAIVIWKPKWTSSMKSNDGKMKEVVSFLLNSAMRVCLEFQGGHEEIQMTIRNSPSGRAVCVVYQIGRSSNNLNQGLDSGAPCYGGRRDCLIP
jgi:hypothetical protein